MVVSNMCDWRKDGMTRSRIKKKQTRSADFQPSPAVISCSCDIGLSRCNFDYNTIAGASDIINILPVA